MVEASGGPAAAMLDELADVTRRYATYVGGLHGLALAAAGVWLLASMAAGAARPDVGRHLLLLTPAAWLGCLAVGRRHYERYGAVIERVAQDEGSAPAPGQGLPPASLLGYLVYRASEHRGLQWLAFGTFSACVASEVFRKPLEAGYAVTFAVSLGLATLMAVVGTGLSGWKDTCQVLLALVFSARAMEPRVFSWFLVVLGAVAVAGGVADHLAYRRVEDRLLALRTMTPFGKRSRDPSERPR
jgi:hypothetical protein